MRSWTYWEIALRDALDYDGDDDSNVDGTIVVEHVREFHDDDHKSSEADNDNNDNDD